MPLSTTSDDLGFTGNASYLLGRAAAALPGVLWHRYRLVTVPRSGMPSMPRGHSGRAMTRTEIESRAFELSAATIAHRLDQGLTCLGAWRGDRLIGVNWVTAGAFDEDEVAVRFIPPLGSAWDTGLYIPPAERGGRAFAALWAATAVWLENQNLDWSASRIADYNLSSWRSHLRMGGRPIGTVAVLGLAGRQWAWGTSASRVDGRLRIRLALTA